MWFCSESWAEGRGLRAGKWRKRPAGCDPAFSPIAAPQLGHIFGRCITSIESPTRFAQALDNSQLLSVQ